jgi:hypothetical protein
MMTIFTIGSYIDSISSVDKRGLKLTAQCGFIFNDKHPHQTDLCSVMAKRARSVANVSLSSAQARQMPMHSIWMRSTRNLSRLAIDAISPATSFIGKQSHDRQRLQRLTAQRVRFGSGEMMNRFQLMIAMTSPASTKVSSVRYTLFG